MIIYLITNQVNGKQYVGQTKGELSKRWRKHITDAKRGSRFYLHRAMRKYGEGNFTAKVFLIVGSKDELDYYEKALIKKLHTKERGYNQTDGGDGGCIGNTWAKGQILSNATRQRMSISHTGQKRTPEQRQNMSISKLGNKNCIGRIVSEATRQKLRDTWKRKNGKDT